jgi:hypothetical protein
VHSYLCNLGDGRKDARRFSIRSLSSLFSFSVSRSEGPIMIKRTGISRNLGKFLHRALKRPTATRICRGVQLDCGVLKPRTLGEMAKQ